MVEVVSSYDLIITPATGYQRQKVVEKIQKRRHEGCDVSPRGGVERPADAIHLIFGADVAHVRENQLRAAGGVKLHGQSDQVEEHDDAPRAGHDPRRSVRTDEASEETDQRQPHEDLVGEIRHSDRGHPPFEGRVSDLMLDRVAALVRSDA